MSLLCLRQNRVWTVNALRMKEIMAYTLQAAIFAFLEGTGLNSSSDCWYNFWAA